LSFINGRPLSSGTYRNAPTWDATTPTSRGSGLGLAIAFNLLIFLVLLTLGAAQFQKKPDDVLVVDMTSSPSASPPPPAAKAEKTNLAVKPKVPPIKPPIQIPIAKPLPMLELTREEFAAADIRNLGHAKGASQQAAADDSQEVGRAPNGEILFGAEWYREPTDAELAGYLPHNAPEGWGLVACKTAPGYRVEDCVELGNSPPGSRLASAVRQAAWQFRVRAPRKNGKELVGAWVQIRIEYMHGTAN
jgi:protein TonB